MRIRGTLWSFAIERESAVRRLCARQSVHGATPLDATAGGVVRPKFVSQVLAITPGGEVVERSGKLQTQGRVIMWGYARSAIKYRPDPPVIVTHTSCDPARRIVRSTRRPGAFTTMPSYA